MDTRERLREILAGGGLPFHPIADEYPLDEDVVLAMAEDIARPGGSQIMPIIMINGLILDGRTRWLACLLAGAEPLTWQYTGADDEATLRAYVESLNEHRRHLSPQWLALKRNERIARVVELRSQGMPLRAIAQEVGVSPTQVRGDLDRAASDGLPVAAPDGQVQGKDGRAYPAGRHGGEVPDPGVHPCTAAPGVLADEAGAAIPPHLRDVFSDPKLDTHRAVLVQWRTAMSGQRGLVRKLLALMPHNPHLRAAMSAERGVRVLLAEAELALDTALDLITQATPCAVCPRCSGVEGGCGHCSHAGWVGRQLYDQLQQHAGYESEQNKDEAGGEGA